jgi:hypothetical protein
MTMRSTTLRDSLVPHAMPRCAVALMFCCGARYDDSLSVRLGPPILETALRWPQDTSSVWLGDRAIMRRIVVRQKQYLWQRAHRHAEDVCFELLTIYAEGMKKSPLRLVFNQNEEWLAGSHAAGCLLAVRTKQQFNLNRPAVVAALIERMLDLGWSPETDSTPRDVENAFEILQEANAPYDMLSV